MVLVVVSALSFLILFIWVLSHFFLMSLVKSLSNLFIFSKNQLLESLTFCIFFRLYFIYFCSDIYYFLLSIYFGLCLLFLFQDPLIIKLDYSLFELFFKDKHVMLWISLLGWLSQCARDFGLLCLHFNLFQGILISSLILLLTHLLFNNMLFSGYVFVCVSVFLLW